MVTRKQLEEALPKEVKNIETIVKSIKTKSIKEILTIVDQHLVFYERMTRICAGIGESFFLDLFVNASETIFDIKEHMLGNNKISNKRKKVLGILLEKNYQIAIAILEDL